jgi:hypothetical protein
MPEIPTPEERTRASPSFARVNPSARRSRLASTRTRAGARIPTTPTHAIVAYRDARAREVCRLSREKKGNISSG